MENMEYKLEIKIPDFVKQNVQAKKQLDHEIESFFNASGEIKKEYEQNTYTLIKDNITGKKPYMNNSYYYLKIKYLSNEEFILYSGVTFKIEDENKKRHSLLNTKLFHCYHNINHDFIIEENEQVYHDDEIKEYTGFLFRSIHAVKKNFLYRDNQLLKKEVFTGYQKENIPYLHQSIQNSIVHEDDFIVSIPCPFYELVNVTQDYVYIKKLYDELEGEKIFTTSKENVDNELNVKDENILIPVDIQTWNSALEGVMKKS